MPAEKSTRAVRSKMFLDRARMAHIDQLLDAALVETFPASDPISVCIEETTRRGREGTTPALRPRQHH